jgi:Flp pilus assembly protein protease CpaA
MLDIITPQNIPLIILALIWIIGAVFQDFRRREVDNLWNFSLIAFALAYRISISIFNQDYWFILNGLIGLAIFFILHNLFYYARLFAGGDAKLLMALGTILPLSFNWIINLKLFGIFIIVFLIGGSIYAILWAFCLVIINWKEFHKEFAKQFKIYRQLFLVAIIFTIIWLVFSFIISKSGFVLIGLVVLLFPVLFTFAKSVEESCMIKKLGPKQVTEGDWLYQDIVVGGKRIKSTWDGVSKKDLELIRKKCKKKILIKQGIPFTPAFLFGFVGMLWLVWKYGSLF